MGNLNADGRPDLLVPNCGSTNCFDGGVVAGVLTAKLHRRLAESDTKLDELACHLEALAGSGRAEHRQLVAHEHWRQCSGVAETARHGHRLVDELDASVSFGRERQLHGLRGEETGAETAVALVEFVEGLFQEREEAGVFEGADIRRGVDPLPTELGGRASETIGIAEGPGSLRGVVQHSAIPGVTRQPERDPEGDLNISPHGVVNAKGVGDLRRLLAKSRRLLVGQLTHRVRRRG